MMLSGGGASIGSQGSSPCSPSDNHWDNGTTCSVCVPSTCSAWSSWTSAGVYQTFTTSGAGPVSTIYYRDAPSQYNITNNGTCCGSSIAYSTSSGLVDLTPICPSLPSTSTCAQYSGFRLAHTTGTMGRFPITEQQFHLFPNPSDGHLEITQDVPSTTPVNVTVFNALGQKVYSGTLQFAGGKTNITLNNVVPGMYQVILSDETGKEWNNKVVIEKNASGKY
jgi:hypothetical protein